MNTLSLMVTRRYPACSGTLRTFGPHWSRHAATLLVNNGMPLEDIKRHVCHIDKVVAVTGRASLLRTERNAVWGLSGPGRGNCHGWPRRASCSDC